MNKNNESEVVKRKAPVYSDETSVDHQERERERAEGREKEGEGVSK